MSRMQQSAPGRGYDPAELRARFVRDGFVANVPLFSSAEMDAFRVQYDALEQRMGLDVRLGDLHHTEPFVRSFALDQRVIDAVADVLDTDEVILISTQFFVKHPPAKERVSSFVAWHQDAKYWKLDPPLSATGWIAIDRVDTENACMRAIPGSHLEGILHHGTAEQEGNVLSVNQAIPPELVDERRAVDICMEPGEASFHDGRVVHGGQPNTSKRRRCGLAVAFVPAFVEREATERDLHLRRSSA